MARVGNDRPCVRIGGARDRRARPGTARGRGAPLPAGSQRLLPSSGAPENRSRAGRAAGQQPTRPPLSAAGSASSSRGPVAAARRCAI
eukprot:11215302-Lingulodinium_polyedra.AAC.2